MKFLGHHLSMKGAGRRRAGATTLLLDRTTYAQETRETPDETFILGIHCSVLASFQTTHVATLL